MMSLGEEPSNNTVAQALVTKAFDSAGRMDWNHAIAHLESAAICASLPLLEIILETLQVFYARAHYYEKLAMIVCRAKELTPPLMMGYLLAERDRHFGRDRHFCIASPPSTWFERTMVMDRLRGFITNGQFSLQEMKVICSLLVQIDDLEMALFVLEKMIDQTRLDDQQDAQTKAEKPDRNNREEQNKQGEQKAQQATSIDEELLSAVISLAIARGETSKIRALLSKIENSSELWKGSIKRARVLIGDMPINTFSDGEDKVIDFMLRSQASVGVKEEKRVDHG